MWFVMNVTKLDACEEEESKVATAIGSCLFLVPYVVNMSPNDDTTAFAIQKNSSS